MSRKYLSKGTIIYAGRDAEENAKKQLSISLSDEAMVAVNADIAEEYPDLTSYNSIPVKESIDGEVYLKLQSKFAINIYEDSDKSNITFDEIGKGTVCEVCFTVQEGKFRGKKYLTGYLTDLNIRSFSPREEENPFKKN